MIEVSSLFDSFLTILFSVYSNSSGIEFKALTSRRVSFEDDERPPPRHIHTDWDTLIQTYMSRSGRTRNPSRILVTTWNYEDHYDWMKNVNPGDLPYVSAKRVGGGEMSVGFLRIDLYSAC